MKEKERREDRERERGTGFRRQFTEASQYTGNANGEIGERLNAYRACTTRASPVYGSSLSL